ncbi:MAG: HD domain-containing protein [Phycisphaerales bacterium]
MTSDHEPSTRSAQTQTRWDPDLLQRAMNFAGETHGIRIRARHERPELVHVSSVAFETALAVHIDHELDADLAMVCALLHDVVEDTDATIDDIKARFGTAVARGVDALTKNPALPKEIQINDSVQRLKEQPNSVQAVKLADRITNLQPPPGAWPVERRLRYAQQSQMILDALGSACPYLADRLSSRIAHYRSRYIRNP